MKTTISKAEDYIRENTKHFSNEWYDDLSQGYESWLTPDQARRAVEIARDEMIEWIEDNIGEYCYGDYLGFSAVNIENIDLFDQKSFISDLKTSNER